MQCTLYNHSFTLVPEAAAYWENTKSLLIADAHLGKISHFRKNGFAVPHRIQFSFYQKIEQLMDRFDVARIFFLGDLFHSDYNREWDQFSAWVQQSPAQAILVKGNHDILPENHWRQSGMEVVPEWREAGFLLTHHPEERENYFNFCGHIHPGVQLQGPGRQRLKTPCFFHRPQQMILPAFGDFTGLHLLQPKAADRVYALTEETVVAVRLVS